MKLDDLKTQTVVSLLKGYGCPTCEKVYVKDESRKYHDPKDEARECCKPPIDEYFVCSVCRKEFQEWDEREAKEHIEHPHFDPIPLITPTEIYLEQLRFGNRPLMDIYREWDIREHNARFRNV